MRRLAHAIAAALSLAFVAAGAPAQDEADLILEMERAIRERDRRAPEGEPPAAPAPAEESATADTPDQAERPGPGPRGLRRARLVDAGDPIAVLAAAERLGPARLARTSDDRPVIVGVSGGVGYSIRFEDCAGGAGCRSLRLRGDFGGRSAAPEAMALWNREGRFARAYLAAGATPVLEMDVNLAGGVSHANLDASLGIWRDVLAEFDRRIGR